MAKRDNDPGARPDEDNPEWMAAAVKKARPAIDVVSEVFGPDVAAELRRGRGRPAKADRKVNQTLRLDADRSEERHIGTKRVSAGRHRRSPDYVKTNKHTT